MRNSQISAGRRFVPALAGMAWAAAFAQPPVDTIQKADELTWRTLAAVSTPSSPAVPPDTPVSWRLWWNSTEVYVDSNPPRVPPQPTTTRGRFLPLPCQQQSELKEMFHSLLQPEDPCEVVWLNAASAGYVFTNGLWIRQNLIAAAKRGQVSFPMPSSVEMKTEWQQISADKFPRYVIGTDNQMRPRGLVAFHLMFRANPSWVWATFIHEDFVGLVTRVGERLTDSFGNRDGHFSPNLLRLLADHHVGVFAHYRLIGTQIDFRNPTRLGNPLIEPPLLITKGQSSCIFCHRFAALDYRGRIAAPPQNLGAPALPRVDFPANFNFTLVEHSTCVPAPGCTILIQ